MIRVFPRATNQTPTDDLAFVGSVPFEFLRPSDPETPVSVSCTFSWDRREAERLADEWGHHYHNVSIGGPAYGDPGLEFVPGRFVATGITFTSRGCPKRCSGCFVGPREGSIRELTIMPGNIVQDNNLLACSTYHINGVFDMLRVQKRGANFAGGLDATLFNDWHRALIDTIRIQEVWFACDRDSAIVDLYKVATMLHGIPKRKRRCYCMMAFQGDTVRSAATRIEEVWRTGFMPRPMLYRDNDDIKCEYSPEWKELHRYWSRPAIYKGSGALKWRPKR